MALARASEEVMLCLMQVLEALGVLMSRKSRGRVEKGSESRRREDQSEVFSGELGGVDGSEADWWDGVKISSCRVEVSKITKRREREENPRTTASQ